MPCLMLAGPSARDGGLGVLLPLEAAFGLSASRELVLTDGLAAPGADGLTEGMPDFDEGLILGVVAFGGVFGCGLLGGALAGRALGGGGLLGAIGVVGTPAGLVGAVALLASGGALLEPMLGGALAGLKPGVFDCGSIPGLPDVLNFGALADLATGPADASDLAAAVRGALAGLSPPPPALGTADLSAVPPALGTFGC